MDEKEIGIEARNLIEIIKIYLKKYSELEASLILYRVFNHFIVNN